MDSAARIAVVQGAASEVVQGVLRQFIARLAPGVRTAGVVEDPVSDDDGGACSAGELRSLSDGRRFSIMQDLGPGSEACILDAGGVASACEAAQRGIAAGCDLVVLSKFGKVEADRGGLASAFAQAIEAGIPVLSSVSPRFMETWDRFAAPFYVVLPPDVGAIEAWWRQAGAANQQDTDKAAIYAATAEEIASVLDGEPNLTARMATVASMLANAFERFFWTGFYVVDPDKRDELVVGPYQGTLGCLRIAFGRGVCGTAAAERRTVIVPDVEAFPGHIACDSRSRSEIVAPVFDAAGALIAVFDVDSTELAAFDAVDAAELETILAATFSR